MRIRSHFLSVIRHDGRSEAGRTILRRMGQFLLGCWLLTGLTVQGQTAAPAGGQAPATQQQLQRAALEKFLTAVAMAKNNLGAVYFAAGNHDSARVHLSHALEIAPDFAAAHLTMGLLYYEDGDVKKAVEAFKKAAADDTVGVRRMDMVPPDTVHTWAREQFNSMMQGPPQLAVAHTALAIVYNQGGYLAEAEHHYRESMQHDSTYMDAYMNLGKLYADTERFEEALGLYERVVRHSVDTTRLAKVYLNIGVSQMGLNRPDRALEAWSKAVNLSPDYAEAYMNMGIAYQRKSMPDSARAVWTRALGVQSDMVVARVALARLEAAEGQRDKAIQYYREILDMGAEDPRIYAELGLVYEQYEEYDQAIANYEAAVALDPSAEELQTALYRVKSKSREQAAARAAKKMRVRQIVVRTQAEAEAILERLKTGGDFARIARAESIDPSGAAGGDLGYFEPGEMIPIFETAAMNLQVGEVSGVIQTAMGYHIIKRIE